MRHNEQLIFKTKQPAKWCRTMSYFHQVNILSISRLVKDAFFGICTALVQRSKFLVSQSGIDWLYLMLIHMDLFSCFKYSEWKLESWPLPRLLSPLQHCSSYRLLLLKNDRFGLVSFFEAAGWLVLVIEVFHFLLLVRYFVLKSAKKKFVFVRVY